MPRQKPEGAAPHNKNEAMMTATTDRARGIATRGDSAPRAWLWRAPRCGPPARGPWVTGPPSRVPVTTPRPWWLALGLLLILAAGQARAEDWLYTVRPGDNLWDLAAEFTHSATYWRRLQRLNKVSQPRRIPPGTQLRFPLAWLKVRHTEVRVVSVVGTVEVATPTGGAHPPKTGETLQAGDEVRTGADGVVVLEFVDGARLRLLHQGHLVLDRLNAYGDREIPDTRLRVLEGEVETSVPRRRGSSKRYEIRTPAATTGVRGTQFRVGMDTARELSRSEVTEGRVKVSAAGESRVIPRGFGTVVKKGEPPAPPRPLLPAPDLSGLPQTLDRLPLQFQWPAVPGAVHYRVQVTPEQDLDRLIYDKMIRRPQLSLPELPDGDYWMRVRAIDVLTLEGLNGDHRFTVAAHPLPPILISPALGSVVRTRTPTFEWSGVEGAAGYHIQLAADEPFAQPLMDRTGITVTRLSPDEPLEAGTYFWRLATIDATGKEGPFSDSQGFDLRPTPASPGAPALEAEGNRITLRWREGLPGQRYQFQMAHDPGFRRLLVDETLDRPELSMARPSAPRVYLRVRILDVDGHPGPWGPTQYLDRPRWPGWPVLGFAVFLLLAL